MLARFHSMLLADDLPPRKTVDRPIGYTNLLVSLLIKLIC